MQWGLAGCSGISARFAAALARVPGAQLGAVASRDGARARTFAASYGAARAHGTYDALFADPEIDLVYVGCEPGFHADVARAALEAGKPVLVEKPFATHADDARAIAALADALGLFCMEAMWMRFNPLVRRLQQMTAENVHGPVRQLTLEVGYRTHADKLGTSDAGRGALLNFGIYGVSLAQALLGAPQAVRGQVLRVEGAVDRGFQAVLEYEGISVQMAGAVDATLSNTARLSGESGFAELRAPFFDPPALYMQSTPEPPAPRRGAGAPKAASGGMRALATRIPFGRAITGSTMMSMARGAKLLPAPTKLDGMALEIAEAMACVRAGRTQSRVMPLSETIAAIESLDQIRAGAYA